MVTVILKVVEMTLLKYPTWGESFPKTMHMLTMIINKQQTMPYYLSDEPQGLVTIQVNILSMFIHWALSLSR